MIEQTREIVRKFNSVYKEVLVEPEALIPENEACLRLPGTDGKAKMSKSLGNYVGIFDAPNEMFGKIMSVSDELMWRWFTLLSFRSMAEIEALQAEVAAGRNPRDVKFELARELVARFHDAAAAAAAQEAFVNRFARNEIPEDLEEIRLDAPDGALGIGQVLKAAGLVSSTSEGLRMVDGGAVKIDGERVESRDFKLARGFSGIVQAGKRRIVKVVIA